MGLLTEVLTGVRKLWPIITLAAIFGILTLLLCLGFRQVYRVDGFRLKPGLHAARQNLQQLLLAIRTYHQTFGELPFHPAGSDHAFYLVKDFVDHSRLSGRSVPNESQSPRWDDINKRILNPEFFYLNKPHVRDVKPRQIVIVSETRLADSCLLGLFSTETVWKSANSNACGAFLGNYVSSEGFIIATEAVFSDWTSTSPPNGPANWRWVDGELKEIEYQTAGLKYWYDYPCKTRIDRFIQRGKDHIAEIASLDDEGRIIGFARDPKDWLNRLQRMKSDGIPAAESGGKSAPEGF